MESQTDQAKQDRLGKSSFVFSPAIYIRKIPPTMISLDAVGNFLQGGGSGRDM